MPITDNDLEMLEGWLDGELAEQDAETLRRRLSTETELTQALDRLRADRQIRSHFFQLLEPNEAEIQPLMANVRREMRKEDLWSARAGMFKQVAKIAAMIVLVFGAGWISRDRLHVGPTAPPQIVLQGQQPGIPVLPIAPRPADPNIRTVSNEAPVPDDGKIQFFTPGRLDLRNITGQNTPKGSVVYVVKLIDPSGNVIGVHQVSGTENPQQVIEQLLRSQTPGMQAPPVQQQRQQEFPPFVQPMQPRQPEFIPVAAPQQ